MKKFDPKNFKPTQRVEADSTKLERPDSVMVRQEDGSLKPYVTTPEGQKASAAMREALLKASKGKLI